MVRAIEEREVRFHCDTCGKVIEGMTDMISIIISGKLLRFDSRDCQDKYREANFG